MTDRYAIERYRQIYGAVPEGLSQCLSQRRVLLAGATGLVGTRVMELAMDQPWLRLVALTRREAPMPRGARMEMLVADPLGLARGGRRDRARRGDLRARHDLAQGGQRGGVSRGRPRPRAVARKAARRRPQVARLRARLLGRRRLPRAKAFYLRVKGEIETALAKLRFRRLDILRPGLVARLAQRRARGRSRRSAMLASPLTDLLLHGDKPAVPLDRCA